MIFALMLWFSAVAQAAPSHYMYILQLVPRLHDDAAWTEADNAIIGVHFRHLQREQAAGRVLFVGRTPEPGPLTRGYVVFEADNESAARVFMESDPAVAEGIMTATVHPFSVALASSMSTGAENAVLVEQVRAVETAFAQTLADRDLKAFQTFIADDAVFLNGGDVLTGKAAIVAHWSQFFEGETAPFAWAPEFVIVLDNGTLAQTNGPVFAADGTLEARFQSVWRRGFNGQWKVIFDNSYPVAQ